MTFQVQFRSAFRFDQYEVEPASFNTHTGHQKTSKDQTEPDFKSHPPFGLLNKNREDKKFGKWVKKRFNSLGSDGGLRKFQKATDSLRRNNFDESDEVEVDSSNQDFCRVYHKNGNVHNLRRTDTKIFNDVDDVDWTLNKEMQKLVGALRKYNQALDDVFIGHIDNVLDADTNSKNLKFKKYDYLRELNVNTSHDSEDNEDDEHEDSEMMAEE